MRSDTNPAPLPTQENPLGDSDMYKASNSHKDLPAKEHSLHAAPADDVSPNQAPPMASIPWRAWCVLVISSVGVFLASVSTSALIIAFPVVLVELNMTMSTMMWVLLVILLLMGAVVPLAGKLGDVVGQARIYTIGYWCFVAGSLGGGFVSSANKGFDLVAARVVIGLGAALLFTNSSAILTNAFAPCGKVGLSQGIMQLFSALGAILGPLIGGAFATSNWRWIFWFNTIPGWHTPEFLFRIAALTLVLDYCNGEMHLSDLSAPPIPPSPSFPSFLSQAASALSSRHFFSRTTRAAHTGRWRSTRAASTSPAPSSASRGSCSSSWP